MILNDINIKIIENEIRRYSCDVELMDLLHHFNGQELINLLLSEKDVLSRMPKSVIENSIDEIKDNFRLILTNCSIGDLKLLEILISCCVDSADIYTLSRKAMLNTTLRPELLNKKFPNFFTEVVLLNYSPVVLDEKYILKLKNLPANINTGFFILQPVTKKLMKKINSSTNIEDVNHFYKALSISLSEGKGVIEKNALKYCLKKDLIKQLLPKYKFNLIEQFKIYKLIKKDIDCFIDFIKEQNIPKIFVKYFVKSDIVHYYLAHNTYCNDDTLIDFHKSKKDINWLYINTRINISNHLKYANYLKEIGESNIIEYNIQINKENGESISNLRTLEKYNINKDVLYNAFSTKVIELEIGIHMDLSKDNFDTENFQQ